MNVKATALFSQPHVMNTDAANLHLMLSVLAMNCSLIIDGSRRSFFVFWTLEQKKADAMHDSS